MRSTRCASPGARSVVVIGRLLGAWYRAGAAGSNDPDSPLFGSQDPIGLLLATPSHSRPHATGSQQSCELFATELVAPRPYVPLLEGPTGLRFGRRSTREEM